MNSQQENFDLNQSTDDGLDLKKSFFKYFYYWKFFVVSCLLTMIAAYSYLRYTPNVYSVSAKIKIIDEKDYSLELPSASNLLNKSKINLENSVEILSSYPILSQVVKNKNLNISVYEAGNVIKSLTVNYPFEIIPTLPIDSLLYYKFKIDITEQGFEIIDFQKDEKKYNFNGISTKKYKHNLPFEIVNFNKELYVADKGYYFSFLPTYDVVQSLKKSIQVSQVGNESDIIQLELKSTSSEYSKIVINEVIKVFNNDGISDRRLVHKRTIDFVNERYAFLSLELDSIEVSKQQYKVNNDLVDFEINSNISLEKSSASKDNIFSTENQIFLTNLLINTLGDSQLKLLPSNLGIENSEINLLISNYNQFILDRKKLVISAGSNNPSLAYIDDLIYEGKKNIIFSLQNHLSQLKNLKNKLNFKVEEYDSQVSNLPKKEKILRAIERNQQIKEALYLFLLQKREEAEVSYAVTEPSIKVVEYAMIDSSPVSPRRNTIYIVAFIMGLLTPFFTIYFSFLLNRKIFSKNQFQELGIPIPLIGEVPEITDQPNKIILSSEERSPLAESFRVLCSNLKFFTKKTNDCQVIMVTSTIKGEGKTFCATNIAFTKASLGKKVLLIGADLHNPQIHSYLDLEKNINGLVNYLVDDSFDWKKSLLRPNSSLNCDVMLCGQIPPNPAQLLNNSSFKKLIDEAKNSYDFIVIDTPPCLLVSDTLSISYLSDLLLFVVRCNHTKIEVLDFLKDIHKKGVIKDNSMIILNGIGANNKYGYGYAYNYNYSYKYGYNYGYGYEYNSSE
ncbi:polysaccharide biosynthesis tyrosine autokinase [Bacteroidota bacterium]|nr:polysaccharide biosynthesis tyrosine autokinase [Bacteroidota bacterium]MDC3114858.1 polysaccharide biosynthesis tyrosine autokinase [Bacteroidota bacterium]MDC3229719.1 polysaccharide biosynthesis tyrosine autokinase [Bacteroidota bacterium]